jgi:hypothetical protein
MSVHLLIGLLFVCLHHHVHAHQNQQIIVDFDQQDQHPIPTTRTTSDIPATVPTGLPAQLIKKVTGWNNTLVAKLLGQISPRPPHPFVVPITDENLENVIESEIDSIHPGWGSDEDTVWVISVYVNTITLITTANKTQIASFYLSIYHTASQRTDPQFYLMNSSINLLPTRRLPSIRSRLNRGKTSPRWYKKMPPIPTSSSLSSDSLGLTTWEARISSSQDG